MGPDFRAGWGSPPSLSHRTDSTARSGTPIGLQVWSPGGMRSTLCIFRKMQPLCDGDICGELKCHLHFALSSAHCDDMIAPLIHKRCYS